MYICQITVGSKLLLIIISFIEFQKSIVLIICQYYCEIINLQEKFFWRTLWITYDKCLK